MDSGDLFPWGTLEATGHHVVDCCGVQSALKSRSWILDASHREVP